MIQCALIGSCARLFSALGCWVASRPSLQRQLYTVAGHDAVGNEDIAPQHATPPSCTRNAIRLQPSAATLTVVFAVASSPVSRRRQITGLALTVLILAAAITLPRACGRPAGSHDIASLCVIVGSPSEQEQAAEEALCYRQDKDAADRKPLPARTTMDSTASKVWRSMNKAVCDPEVGFCMGRPPATDEDVALVRQVLRDEGFPNAIVRLARPEDPAPAGAIMYAVALPGGICIVSDVEPGNGPLPRDISGTLPDGQCLDA
jgi:hypothetical protein